MFTTIAMLYGLIKKDIGTEKEQKRYKFLNNIDVLLSIVFVSLLFF